MKYTHMCERLDNRLTKSKSYINIFDFAFFMTEYKIKTYQEEFIEDQFKIGTEVSKNWQLFGQTPVERLKEAYSQEGFDPETRLYCFKGEEMIGFLTSSVLPEQEEGKTVANLSIPMVLEGHEEAIELLIEKALKVLKSKGAELVRTVASDSWGSYSKIPEKLGYEHVRDTGILVNQEISDIATVEETEDVEAYDKERDLDELVQIFVKELGMTEEQAVQNFDLIDNSENILGHYVVRKDDKIVARTYAALNQEEPTVTIGYIYATDEDSKKQLVSKIINASKEKEIKNVQSFLFGGMIAKLEEYEALGFQKVGKASLFEKKL